MCQGLLSGYYFSEFQTPSADCSGDVYSESLKRIKQDMSAWEKIKQNNIHTKSTPKE